MQHVCKDLMFVCNVMLRKSVNFVRKKNSIVPPLRNMIMTHEKQVPNLHTGEFEHLNDNFVQLYIDKLDLIIEMTGENPTAVKVFVWLLKHMDKRNALVVSQEALAEAMNMHRTTIFRCVNYLKEKKAVDIVKSGNTNIYAINAQIAWKSNANGKNFALFDAAVYVAESEQQGPLFSTDLVGHAVIKKPKKVRPLRTKEPAE